MYAAEPCGPYLLVLQRAVVEVVSLLDLRIHGAVDLPANDDARALAECSPSSSSSSSGGNIVGTRTVIVAGRTGLVRLELLAVDALVCD
jgi:hypothetical protein